MRPVGSVKVVVPVTVPVVVSGLPGVAETATGVPASTATATPMTTLAVLTPLVAVMVMVSVVPGTVARRWASVGV